ncbi:MAG TPA: hypothetical protein PLC42_00290 [Parachlamydiaceae bacterium]|nr:hypothetical protein [Parachlamydiaceae bacterium]
MDIVNLLISLLSGAAGGNVAGAAMPDKSLGTLGNTLSGILGGGLGGYLLQALNLFGAAAQATGGTGLDIGSILANIGSSGVGGAVLMAVIGLIKNAMEKR